MQKPLNGKGAMHVQKKEPSQQKKETRSLSAVTGEVTTLKSFLLLVEGPTCPFLFGTLVNLSTSSSHFCYQQPTNKNTQ